jgi:hypothetical protein
LQQQTGTSASAPDVQPLPTTCADAPQPTVAKAQAKNKAPIGTKAQPKWQKSVPISASQLAPSTQAEPADAPKQAIDPSPQRTSSVVIPQEPTADETTEALLSVSALINPGAKDIPLAGIADPFQGTLQITTSSQRQ